MKLNPYEPKNLIFIDTEFTDLDPNTGELLSVGIVKLNGEELYIELSSDMQPSEWVTHHIVPTLLGPKYTPSDAAKEIRQFLGESMPFAVAFVDNYDLIYLTKLFGVGKLPFRWVTIDFTSILFAHGINPVKLLDDPKGAMSFYKKLGIKMQNYRKHHALDDAKLLRDVWLKVVETDDEEQTL